MSLPPLSLEDVLFPGVLKDNWQMTSSERIALTGILSRLKPRLSIEIGVYYGGSLSLTAQYVDRVIAVDIDPLVKTRFNVPKNAEIRIGNSADIIPKALEQIARNFEPLSFVLIDADHSAAGVKRDIELFLDYAPVVPMIILVHDSGNAGCRRGISSVDFAKSRYVKKVDLDFVPGQIIEHSVATGRPEIWGGICLIYLEPSPRVGAPYVTASSRTTIEVLQAHSK